MFHHGLDVIDDLAKPQAHVHSHSQGNNQKGDVAAQKHTQLCNAERRFRVRVREDSIEHGKKGGCSRSAVCKEEG